MFLTIFLSTAIGFFIGAAILYSVGSQFADAASVLGQMCAFITVTNILARIHDELVNINAGTSTNADTGTDAGTDTE